MCFSISGESKAAEDQSQLSCSLLHFGRARGGCFEFCPRSGGWLWAELLHSHGHTVGMGNAARLQSPGGRASGDGFSPILPSSHRYPMCHRLPTWSANTALVALPDPTDMFLLCVSATPWTTTSSPQSKGSSMKTMGICSLRSSFLMKTLSASGTGHLPEVLGGPVCSSIPRELWELGEVGFSQHGCSLCSAGRSLCGSVEER